MTSPPTRHDSPRWIVSGGGRPKSLDLGLPRVLGILNITPDSFSDGGTYPDADAARAAGEAMLNEGAIGLDIGGESTRPGAEPVPNAEQLRRVLPVLAALRQRLGDEFIITIDTTSAEVARAALDHGADAINDVSAGTHDRAMLPLAAERGAGVILMHRRVAPAQDQYSDRYSAAPTYEPLGVVGAVREYLAGRAHAAIEAGVAPGAIVLDPGLGFGKSVGQNLELIQRAGEIVDLGYPVMSGISRKSFTPRAAGLPGDTPMPARLFPTLGLSVLHLVRGARLFRVHDVAAHVDALSAAWAAIRPC